MAADVAAAGQPSELQRVAAQSGLMPAWTVPSLSQTAGNVLNAGLYPAVG